MRSDLILLCFAYVLSQFYRAFLAVLAQVLKADTGATPEDLAFASGLWFLVFAAMQLPVGWALDHLGPRRTSSVLLLIGGGGGALLFAFATTPMHINLAMGLIGVGCSPVLMASYYIFARSYPPAQFATLAALMLGLGSVGNLIAAYPMTLATELIGWRMALVGLAGLSALTAIGLFFMVQDPPRVVSDVKGSFLDLLKIPALWLIFPLTLVNYTPSAAIRGLWIGPYLNDVFAASPALIGTCALLMGIAMIAGTFTLGPLDRILGTRKWVIFAASSTALGGLVALTVWTSASLPLSVALMCVVGFFGAAYPAIVAHGASFAPAHLKGRGITLMNLFSIGGVGLFQSFTGPLHDRFGGVDPSAGYTALFLFFTLIVVAGLALYVFSEDRTG